MSTGGWSHFAVQKRSIRIGIFNVICWVLGVIIGFTGLAFTSVWWWLLCIPIGIFIGLPLPDEGSPHAWLFRKWHAKSQWRRDEGIMLHAPLTAGKDDKPGKIGQVEVVMARIKEADGQDSFLPLLTTTEREYVTMPLRLGGASQMWLSSDGDGKYDWDLDWQDAVARALSTTREPTLDFVQTRIHRPVNKEPGLAHNRSRVNQRVLAAAASDGKDPQYNDVETGIGKNLMAGFAAAHAIGGEPSNYAMVRMSWPRRHGRKISLDHAAAFRKSNLFKTIGKVYDAYRQMDVAVDFVNLDGVNDMWDEHFNLTDLDTLRMYRERDKELPALKGPVDMEPKLRKPVSIRASEPGKPGYVKYGSTYHVAGYATSVNRSPLRPGFQTAALHLSDDSYYSFATFIKASLVTGVTGEKSKAREKERLLRTLKGFDWFTTGLTKPEQDIQFEEVLQRRVRLAEGSQRSADFHLVNSMAGRSLEEAEARWDDMIADLAGYYTFERADDRDDIWDILLAELGVKVD